MKCIITCLVLFLFHVTKVISQDAADIVRRANEKMRGKTLVADLTIMTVRPDWEREMGAKVWMKEPDYAMILITSPAKDEGSSFLKIKKEVWNWIPSVERVIKLPPSMMTQSWMGTDFTNDDLVKESSIVDDYSHSITGSEIIDSRDCHVIELTPKPKSAVVWNKVILWIDKDEFIEMKCEFYDEGNELINIMTSSVVKEMGGRLIPTRFEMIPADKPTNKTILIYNSITFDSPLSKDFFTVQKMKELE